MNLIKYSSRFKFVGMFISAIFTILLLTTFSKAWIIKLLLGLAGAINEIIKVSTLSATLDCINKKSLKAFIFAGLCLPFMALSLAASISFNMYIVEEQMYERVVIEDNTNVDMIANDIASLKNRIAIAERERQLDNERFNAALDEISLEDIAQIQAITGTKNILMAEHDHRINEFSAQLTLKNNELLLANDSSTREEIEVLANNSLTGFFTAITPDGKEVRDTVFIFAICLGVVLDLFSIVFAIIEMISIKEEKTPIENILIDELKKLKEKNIDRFADMSDTIEQLTQKKHDTYDTYDTDIVKRDTRDTRDTHDTHDTHDTRDIYDTDIAKHDTYDLFVKIMKDNNLAATDKNIYKTYFEEHMSRSTYARLMKQYRDNDEKIHVLDARDS